MNTESWGGGKNETLKVTVPGLLWGVRRWNVNETKMQTDMWKQIFGGSNCGRGKFEQTREEKCLRLMHHVFIDDNKQKHLQCDIPSKYGIVLVSTSLKKIGKAYFKKWLDNIITCWYVGIIEYSSGCDKDLPLKTILLH